MDNKYDKVFMELTCSSRSRVIHPPVWTMSPIKVFFYLLFRLLEFKQQTIWTAFFFLCQSGEI
jgi:hypothetical protein